MSPPSRMVLSMSSHTSTVIEPLSSSSFAAPFWIRAKVSLQAFQASVALRPCLDFFLTIPRSTAKSGRDVRGRPEVKPRRRTEVGTVLGKGIEPGVAEEHALEWRRQGRRFEDRGGNVRDVLARKRLAGEIGLRGHGSAFEQGSKWRRERPTSIRDSSGKTR